MITKNWAADTTSVAPSYDSQATDCLDGSFHLSWLVRLEDPLDFPKVAKIDLVLSW